jgi:DNA mismatch repair protein MSH6
MLRLLCRTGAAIAAAVLDHLAHTSRCCGLFATHYHQLAAEHAADPQVAIMHMACAVAEQQPPSAGAAAAAVGAAATGEPEQQHQSQEGCGAGAGEDDVAEVTFLYKLTAGE